MSPTRRAVLTGLAVGVSGCTALPGNRTDSPAGVQSQNGTRDGKTPSENDCTAGYDVSVAPFAPATDLPITLDREAERELVAAAVDEGSTTYETYAQAPLNAGGVVERDESYYRLSVTQTGRKEVEAYLFDLSWEKGRTAPSGATVYDYEQLPGIDREALKRLVSPEGEERRPTQGLTVRESPVPYPDGGDGSRLLPEDTAWVRWNDREYRVSTGEQTTTDLRTFEYGANQIADDAAGLREGLRPSISWRSRSPRTRSDGSSNKLPTMAIATGSVRPHPTHSPGYGRNCPTTDGSRSRRRAGISRTGSADSDSKFSDGSTERGTPTLSDRLPYAGQ